MKGLLIYPPEQLIDVETPRPLGYLGLLYLASSLEKNNIETDILDATIGTPTQSLKETYYNFIRQENNLIKFGMEFEDIAEYVVSKKYDFVGLNANLTPQTRMAFETAKAIRKADNRVKIYVGGISARALKERFLKTGYFDGVCLTDGELIFPRMIKEGIENVSGFAYKDKNGNMKINPVNESCFPKHLDDLPMPAWEKLAFNKYEEIYSPHGIDVTGKEDRKYAPIITSRGCVWRCAYCHNSFEKYERKLRLHSIERVISEIEKLKSFGVKKLFIQDDTLLTKEDRIKRIFGEVKSSGLSILDANGVNLIDLYIKNRNKKWQIDVEYLKILKQAGFDEIVFPVENGSQRILNKYAGGKIKLNKMDLVELVETTINMGIQTPVNMIIGFPDETEEEVQQTINLSKKLKNAGAPYVTFFTPAPFPNTALYDMAINGGHLDKDFNTDLMNIKEPVMKNTTIPPERIIELKKSANEEVNGKEFIKKKFKRSAKYKLNQEIK